MPRGAAAPDITRTWKVVDKASIDHFGERCKITEIEGSVGPLWMVDNKSCASRDACNGWNFSEAESHVYQTMKETAPQSPRVPNRDTSSNTCRQATIPNMACADGLFLHAGDTVSLIRPVHDTLSDQVCLFVTSMLAQVGDGVTERLVWVSVCDSEGATPRKYLKITVYVTVTGLPAWKCGSRHIPTFPTKPVSNRGVLSNGKRDIVSRIVLYTEKFGKLKSLSDQREVGGGFTYCRLVCQRRANGHGLAQELYRLPRTDIQ